MKSRISTPKLAREALTRSQRGRSSVRSGRGFEDALDETLQAYERQSVAKITPAPPRTVGTPGRMRYADPSAVDYVGHFRGIPVAFDAKSATDEATFRLPNLSNNNGKDFRRTMRQIEWLLEWRRTAERFNQRAVAFLLLHDNASDYCWVLGGDALELLYKRPLDGCPIRAKRGGIFVEHYLPYVAPSSTLALAQGEPRWRFLETALNHYL